MSAAGQPAPNAIKKPGTAARQRRPESDVDRAVGRTRSTATRGAPEPVPRRAVGVLAAVKRTCGLAKRCRAVFACGSCRAHLLENSPATAFLGCSAFTVAQYRQISLADCKIYLAQVARLALLPPCRSK